jgi:hypothetical protein
VLDAYERQPVSLPNGEDGFDAVFVTASGEERRVPWRCLPQVVDEVGGPVRSFRSFRGQRYPGWYWSATPGRRIGFESWVARTSQPSSNLPAYLPAHSLRTWCDPCAAPDAQYVKNGRTGAIASRLRNHEMAWSARSSDR